MISELCAEVTSSLAGCAGLEVIAASGERLVNAAENIGGALSASANDDAVGMKEIDDRGAFAQELGIGNNVEALGIDAMAMQHAANPLIGVDGYGTFLNDDLVAVDGAGYLRDDGLNVGKVGGAGVSLGRADGDEDGLALLDSRAEVAGKAHGPVPMTGQQLRQVVFKNGHAAFAEGFDPGLIVVDAEDGMPHFGKANGCNKSHVPGPDDADGNWL